LDNPAVRNYKPNQWIQKLPMTTSCDRLYITCLTQKQAQL